ncbi:hypothetical protein [Actinomadura livida]|uniref:Tetrahydromethanopterin S-methyltransferase subunit G n=1 Tax=Actinomadura livida TaxID=79909 RepID=A0A7W7I907_9ACTN|nr:MULTISPECIES: hypothetical protein [Actinomadura]MBB4772727.1 tetrahydromethanopterin S-methyltransferase subunit G [Actinomadura catellatispora]GGU12371.1 hypothetical protein GCM10010208_41410 [Actinomadura livida]
MPTPGSTQRKFRLADDALWAEYDQACRDINGSTDRSDDIRKHVEAVVAEWKQRHKMN